MALKALFQTMKKEGYVLKDLDQYLLGLNSEDNDRAINVNAPSSASGCLRANYYSRIGAEKDPNSIEPRLRRIFDNGSYVHDRIQTYLMKQGMLLMPEVPLRSEKYKIQGHTDGYLRINAFEIAILEVKSIRSEGFVKLKDADENHKEQAIVYMYCAEERRLYLQATYTTEKAFLDSEEEREEYFASLFQHLKGGKKYIRGEKIAFQVGLCLKSDSILYYVRRPITKVIFIYEDKNDQNIKEFCVSKNDEILQPILERYEYLNNCVETKSLPNREGTAKSYPPCKWCNYKLECWN